MCSEGLGADPVTTRIGNDLGTTNGRFLRVSEGVVGDEDHDQAPRRTRYADQVVSDEEGGLGVSRDHEDSSHHGEQDGDEGRPASVHQFVGNPCEE